MGLTLLAYSTYCFCVFLQQKGFKPLFTQNDIIQVQTIFDSQVHATNMRVVLTTDPLSSSRLLSPPMVSPTSSPPFDSPNSSPDRSPPPPPIHPHMVSQGIHNIGYSTDCCY